MRAAGASTATPRVRSTRGVEPPPLPDPLHRDEQEHGQGQRRADRRIVPLQRLERAVAEANRQVRFGGEANHASTNIAPANRVQGMPTIPATSMNTFVGNGGGARTATSMAATSFSRTFRTTHRRFSGSRRRTARSPPVRPIRWSTRHPSVEPAAATRAIRDELRRLLPSQQQQHDVDAARQRDAGRVAKGDEKQPGDPQGQETVAKSVHESKSNRRSRDYSAARGGADAGLGAQICDATPPRVSRWRFPYVLGAEALRTGSSWGFGAGIHRGPVPAGGASLLDAHRRRLSVRGVHVRFVRRPPRRSQIGDSDPFPAWMPSETGLFGLRRDGAPRGRPRRIPPNGTVSLS